MRRIAFALLVLSLVSVMADRADCRGGKPGGSSAVGSFSAVGGSGVSGTVSLRSVGPTTTRISLRAEGLQVDVEYIAVWGNNSDCAQEVELMSRVLQRFRGGKRGTASVTVDVPVAADQIHSISLRLGNYLGLVACAPVNQ